MSDISIFAKPTFLNIAPAQAFKDRTKPIPKGRGHLQRVSSLIRGDQIADRIGAKFNPTEGYENDVCIYVKPGVAKGEDFLFEGKKSYLDIVDGHNLSQLAQKHPGVGMIVCSDADKEVMEKEVKNEIIVIPQHHCNFNKVKRTRDEVTRIGVIGEVGAFDYLPGGLEAELKKIGVELVLFSRFFYREDIINFYMNIDLQLVWRPYKKILSNPLKIVNASSFGVPTIALDEPAFHEVSGCYIPVKSPSSIIGHIKELSTQSVYSHYSNNCLEKSEDYHIDKVSNLYKQL